MFALMINYGKIIAKNFGVHFLKSRWCRMDWLLEYHFKGFVVCYDCERFTILVVEKGLIAENYTKTFSLDIAIIGLCLV
jgi:hypothetical protein